MSLTPLFLALADVFDGSSNIERAARSALLETAPEAARANVPASVPLPHSVLTVMAASDAHQICDLITQTPLPWAPPQTSTDASYIAHSAPKVHVELLGPDGVVVSDLVRLGLYGIQPNAEYGIRTHPAEEVFIMLAGEADWKRGERPYQTLRPGARSHHPPMMKHATRTQTSAFLSAYVWHGDVSKEKYVYAGIPRA